MKSKGKGKVLFILSFSLDVDMGNDVMKSFCKARGGVNVEFLSDRKCVAWLPGAGSK